MATSLALLFTVFFSTLFFLTNQSANKIKSVHIDLIHRDSPLSPLYNPNSTVTDRWNAAYNRSMSRYANMELALTAEQFMETLNVTVVQTKIEYLMNFSIGNPPTPIMVMMDTGSDLFWIECLPCYSCFSVKDQVFDPSKSSTYSEVPCMSSDCQSVDSTFCDQNQTCSYAVYYRDNTHSDGVVSKDQVLFTGIKGQPQYFENIIFGCGNNNVGHFTEKCNGIVGLGAGPESLINQLGLRDVPRKLSHCFVPLWKANISHMIIGNILHDVKEWTDLKFREINNAIFYAAELDGISVGPERLVIDHDVFGEGTIVDTGTTLTVLPDIAFHALRAKLEEMIKLDGMTLPEEPSWLCYSGQTTVELQNIYQVPWVTLHFRGLDVRLHPSNMFTEYKRSIVCLAIEPGKTRTVIGNHAMQDMLVQYDLEKMALSMSPFDCSIIG